MDTTTLPAGCWTESWWGRYGPARSVLTMLEAGWQADDDYALALIAEAYLAMMGPSVLEDHLPTGWAANADEVLEEALDRAIRWAQDRAPDGHTVGWQDGEFGCWPADTEW